MEKSITKTCAGCKKEFLIIPQEKAFYEQKNLPFPSSCHECRKIRRQGLRNDRKLYQRNCDQCGISLETTYAKDSPYIIYCEKCYFDSVN
ncbi:hypothetical protein COY07_05915 [Candidatus Peregrinibacteria bacterium CG_4_10_14_0_2_um_filter_43_11]|nr:MAG: hypothetical protein COY07_05915 [Candidatus Peregrinibacteria bacterium CG_4_10_14_0_2_um_filter_43_11]